MAHYEMLFVLPGTLTETEVAPIVTTVKDALVGHGAAEVTVQDMGKSRLAYPIQNIRYGYFYLAHFTAETRAMQELENRVRLINNVLRLVVRSFDPSKPRLNTAELKLTPLSSVVGSSDTETAVSPPFRRDFAPREIRREPVFQPKISEVKVTTPEAGKISLEEIEQKLDEILEHDLEKV